MSKLWLPTQSRLRPGVDLNSLQTRLTAGVVLASLVGIGTMTAWMGWRTQQILTDRHRQNAALIADRLRDDVRYYATTMSVPAALEKVIDHRTTGDLAIWVTSPAGDILAQSETLKMGSWQTSGVAQALLQNPIQSGTHILAVQDWQLVVCSQPTAIEGLPPSTLYVANDVTADVGGLRALLRMLLLASTLMVTLLAIACAFYIRCTLSPMRKLNRLASEVTADTLAQPPLNLGAAPTEVQELAHTYNLMLNRLSKAWVQQKRFFSDMSHELRTPLSLVQGYVESTLRRGENLTPAQREGLTIAAGETQRTVHLLTQLLELARLDQGQTPVKLEVTDLKGVVYEAIALAKADYLPADREASRVTVDGDACHLVIKTDALKLRTLLVELLDNARRYSAPPQAIAVHLLTQDGWAVIQVQDGGIGIPFQCQGDIFDPFYRVDEARSRGTGGTGLGLTLARSLVTALGGQLSVESQPGQGSVFTVRLPI
jgi:signal transduction histidine kinase